MLLIRLLSVVVATLGAIFDLKGPSELDNKIQSIHWNVIKRIFLPVVVCALQNDYMGVGMEGGWAVVW